MTDNPDDIAIEYNCTPPDLRTEAKKTFECLIPSKSKFIYQQAYESFKKWKSSRNTNLTSENVLLAYFNVLLDKYKPSTLWAQHSMLKSMIKLEENIDIGTYVRLNAFLKTKSKGFQSKKSNTFTSQDIETFLNTAPDDQYLAT